jgi:hypothetical protein
MGLARTISLAVAAAIASPAGGQVSAEYDQGWFVFAEKKIEGFELKARTGWNAHKRPPFVSEVKCFGDNQDVVFTVNQSGGIELIASQFVADFEADGDRQSGTLLRDVLWLYIDGERYELRNIPAPSNRFANFSYPPVEPGIMLPVWRGTPSVRKSDSEPFRPLSSLYEQIVNAKKFEWRMKIPDPLVHDRNRGLTIDPKRRYRIDNAGLREAVEWCRRQVASPAARTLPADLLAKLSGGGDK